ncbi:hypothetical protein AGABI2DRAFT_204905 [Agaricus bisporus var. bisporus H97]|uniref:hypothetical protein n=1 Tax=Agaricus bisporus var. bisporus (strain H97 / ATCC MYA-4626 / FGSC 10389) TaxID=936046 RepID=UPI00029F7F6E|nr:hypothetical protein AGABI2DRAFT_204905 [Agaricus bisporus var. bisporus H97]EKV47602.1 hypothetical protein AGABI2DRAFT_204905 [Agaricus bisporus var. bisporus H97]
MLPRRLVLLVGRNAHLIKDTLPEHGHPKLTLACTRNLHTPVSGNSDPSSEIPKPKPKPAAAHVPHSSQRPQHRHEVHERSESLSVPGFNPPGGGGGAGPGGASVFEITRLPLFDAALTTIIGLGMVFVGGIAYVRWYKKNVLDKIEAAFAGGYDPALELAKQHTSRPTLDEGEYEEESYGSDEIDKTLRVRRKEQNHIDDIVQGRETGHYFMLLGPKGSGKNTMVYESMAACQAEGVSVCDAHPDLEVFRLRLGKAINYEFNEDSQTGLFQRRDPREGGAGLDIERALNKLEKVALRSCQRTGRPLVLIINNVHFFKNDEEGRGMLLQLQQKAEAWAVAGIMTMVFTSDDFWPYHYMRRTGTQMHTISISDLDIMEAKRALQQLRPSRRTVEPSIVDRLVNMIAKARDMDSAAEHMLNVEKQWLLSQIGLIPDCDDDVMDEQKWSSCSWLLLREFVKIHKEQEQEARKAIEAGELKSGDLHLPLPRISYGKCRQIMTRTDFMEELDRLNIISIDINHDVHPDSMLILHAAREVCEEEDFDEILDGVRDRIDEIESLHRTRELTFKDLEHGDKIDLSVDKGGSISSISSKRRDDD